MRWASALTAVTLLYACARDSEPKSYRVAPTVKASGQSDEADLVNAVSPGGSESPVGLKFKVVDPPKVGQTAHLDLVLAQDPGLDVSHMLVSLQPGDGLTLESDRSIEFQMPPPGATHRMKVALRAQQQGLLSLNATVLVDAGNTSLTRSFTIPVIAEP